MLSWALSDLMLATIPFCPPPMETTVLYPSQQFLQDITGDTRLVTSQCLGLMRNPAWINARHTQRPFAGVGKVRRTSQDCLSPVNLESRLLLEALVHCDRQSWECFRVKAGFPRNAPTVIRGKLAVAGTQVNSTASRARGDRGRSSPSGREAPLFLPKARERSA